MSRGLGAGTLIDGRFEICKEMKAFPMLFLVCYDYESKEMVLLESISEKYMGSSDAKKRFMKFAEDWLALGAHKNIVSARSVVHIKGKPYLCVDYVPPLCCLSKYFMLNMLWETPPIGKILRLALDICKGMEWVTRGDMPSGCAFAHGNLAPQNIFVTDDEVAKITDFGILQLMRDIRITTKRRELLIKDGVWGYPNYMSPEQWQVNSHIDVRSDVYSFGCVLYHLLTGRNPLSCETISKCKQAHLTVTPADPRTLNPNIPSELASIVLRCLEKQPQDRYDGFKTLQDDLAKIYRSVTGEIGPEETPQDVTAWEMATKAYALSLFDRHKEAGEWCDKALALSPTCCRAWEVKALLRRRSGDNKGALVCLDRALQKKDKDATLLTSKGMILMEMDDFRGALECFEKALELEPKHVDAQVYKGRCLILLGEYEKAIEWSRQVLENSMMNDMQLSLMWKCLGDAYSKLGDRDEAIRCYDTAYEVWPFDVQPLVDKGYLLAENGKYEQALECFRTSVASYGEKDARAWVGKGLMSVYLNKAQDAVQSFEKALQYDPGLAERWVKEAQELAGANSFLLLKTRGEALQSAGKRVEASVCIDKALELNPRDADLWRLKGYAYMRQHDERAIECFDKVIELNPLDEDAWFSKGLFYRNKANGAKAVECFDKALEINPKNARAWFHKALTIDMLLDDLRLAIACYDKAIELCPDEYDFWVQKGIACRTLGEYEEALVCFERATQIDPDDDEAWGEMEETHWRYSDKIFEEGMKQLDEHDYEKAMDSFQKALAFNPDNKKASRALKKVRRKLREIHEVIQWCDMALKVDATDAQVWNYKGMALCELKRSQDAIECYDRAIQINPSFALAWKNKGIVLAKRSQFEEALKCFDRAVQIEPQNADTWCFRGNTLYILGRVQEAYDCYATAVKLKPRDADAWFNVGQCLVTLGRLKEAARALRKFLKIARPEKYAVKIETAEKLLGNLQVYLLMTTKQISDDDNSDR